MITVSIVEDDPLTRDSLAELLSLAKGIEVLATYADAESAVKAVPANAPDVLLVDINLPGKSGIECVAALKAALPAMQVLMLTTYDNSDAIFDSLRAGAGGYMLKRTRGSELIAAIKEVQEGGSPMSAKIARMVVHAFQKPAPRDVIPPAHADLTAKEKAVMQLLQEGFLYKEIAERMGISAHTVHFHLRHIYEKLQVRSRSQAVAKYTKK